MPFVSLGAIGHGKLVCIFATARQVSSLATTTKTVLLPDYRLTFFIDKKGHEGNLSRSSNMAMVRSPRISLNSIGEDKRSRNSLNLSVSSIKDLMMSASPDDGLGDDDVFDTNQENTVTKALGALGKAPEGKSVTDAAMRAMFAKKAARTIHGSLKQRAKSMSVSSL